MRRWRRRWRRVRLRPGEVRASESEGRQSPLPVDGCVARLKVQGRGCWCPPLWFCVPDFLAGGAGAGAGALAWRRWPDCTACAGAIDELQTRAGPESEC